MHIRHSFSTKQQWFSMWWHAGYLGYRLWHRDYISSPIRHWFNRKRSDFHWGIKTQIAKKIYVLHHFTTQNYFNKSTLSIYFAKRPGIFTIPVDCFNIQIYLYHVDLVGRETLYVFCFIFVPPSNGIYLEFCTCLIMIGLLRFIWF